VRAKATPAPLPRVLLKRDLNCPKTNGAGLILWFDPRREHSFVAVGNLYRRRDAGTVKAGSVFAPTRRAWP